MSRILKMRPALIALALVAVNLFVFMQVRGFLFVDWDDNLYVSENVMVQAGLTTEGLRWAFSTFHAGNWHPLTWVSHMLDVQLFGMDTGAHHLTNVFWHVANSLMLFTVLWKLTGALWRSALVAALFAIHPLHVESVAWVAERKDVLSTFFFLLTLLFYRRYVSSPSVGRYLPVFMAMAFGLMAKPMLVTLPFVLLLLDYWPLNRVQPDRQFRLAGILLEKLPLFALALISAYVTLLAQKSGGAITGLGEEGAHGLVGNFGEFSALLGRLSNASVVAMTYFWKTFVPVNLAFFYPYESSHSPAELAIAVSSMVLMTAVCVALIRKAPYLAVGWFLFLGCLVPVIGFVQVGLQGMADRYMYIPAIGLFLMISWGLKALLDSWPRLQPAVLSLVVVSLLFLIPAAQKQAATWSDNISLYRHATEVTAKNRFAYYKLGTALAFSGDYEAAIAPLKEAVSLQPYDLRSRFNLGVVYLNLNRLDEAETEFLSLLEKYPSYQPAQTQVRIIRAKKRLSTGE